MATIKAIEGRSVHQIQSGQVIVDLNSVVKELVENSLDAGATSIDIRFKNQGLDSIEVQDNGKGISSDDFETVALKHHTSKLSTYDDLTSLDTFGFRGEALSSLCALSKFHILTARTEDGPVGKRLDFELSGKLKSASVAAAQKGTTVCVDDIFFNLPVRRKELEKNIKREYTKVISLLYQYACISVGVRFSVSNQMPKAKKVPVLSTKSNTTTKENIVNVFGAKTLLALIKLDLTLDMAPNTGPGTQGARNWSTQATDRSLQVCVQGHISKPVFGEGRQAPDRQMFFVNSRPCQLPQVSKAINEVYKSFNVTQSPFIFANLVMDTNAYDVNVSPDKRTIMLHDQTALLESLKAALNELFEHTDHTVPQSTLPNKKLPAYQPLKVAQRHSPDAAEVPQEPTLDDSVLRKSHLPQQRLLAFQPLTVPQPASMEDLETPVAMADHAVGHLTDDYDSSGEARNSHSAVIPHKRGSNGTANATPPSVLQGWLGRDANGRNDLSTLRKPSADLSKDKQRLSNALKSSNCETPPAAVPQDPDRATVPEQPGSNTLGLPGTDDTQENKDQAASKRNAYTGWDREAMRQTYAAEAVQSADAIVVDSEVAERLWEAHARAEAKTIVDPSKPEPDREPDPVSTPYDDSFSQRPANLMSMADNGPVAPVAVMQHAKGDDSHAQEQNMQASTGNDHHAPAQAAKLPQNFAEDISPGPVVLEESPIPAIAPSSRKGTPGPVQNAFDRMRPKRKPFQIAEITVGNTTTTTVIGGSPLYKKRRVYAPNNSQAIANFGASPLLARGLRNFAATGSQLAVDTSGVHTAATPADDLGEPDSNGGSDADACEDRTDGTAGALRDDEDRPSVAGEDRTSHPLDALFPAPADDDEYDEDYIDEREKRIQEDERVARLIQEAEEAAARPTYGNLRRASQVLKSGATRKESTLNLTRTLHVSSGDIAGHQWSLRNGGQVVSAYAGQSGDRNAVVKDELGDIEAESKLSLTVSKADFERMIIVGQFNLGFVLAIRPAVDENDEDELFIIDQHAADEKYNYERLQRTVTLQSQRLVRPKPLELTAIEEEVILNNPDALKANGFEIETTSASDDDDSAPSGRRCRLLTLPISGEKTFEISDLEELLHLLSETPAGAVEIPRPRKVQRMLAMRACRSSIMVGKTLTQKQMAKVVRHMGEMEKPWNCPHGRPTMRHLASLWAWRGWQEGDVVDADGKEDAGAVQVGRRTDWKAWMASRK